ADVLRENSQLRIVGTRNLVAAAQAAGARRLIAQSIAFAYAPGPEPHAETDALASAEGDAPPAQAARGARAASIRLSGCRRKVAGFSRGAGPAGAGFLGGRRERFAQKARTFETIAPGMTD